MNGDAADKCSIGAIWVLSKKMQDGLAPKRDADEHDPALMA